MSVEASGVTASDVTGPEVESGADSVATSPWLAPATALPSVPVSVVVSRTLPSNACASSTSSGPWVSVT